MRIVVIGAGAIGAASALALAEAGADVVVVDRAGVAGETSSRCEGNILVSDKGPGAEAARPAEGGGKRVLLQPRHPELVSGQVRGRHWVFRSVPLPSGPDSRPRG